ncbi:MAG TPA: tetratricopeptide repeat protein [Armatimonadota bacterium]|nr:tetratricopeptide repeat protein [Armatimonadota bacterium]
MVCEKCGATTPDGWPNCLDCGAAVNNPAATPGSAQGVETDVFPLLASANLSRIRGQFQEAENQCVEVLRRFPNNPAAHSLLGEIYEEQGRFKDAVTWYQLALELDPTNEADRSLLARAIQKQANAERRSAAPPTPSGWRRLMAAANPQWGIITGLVLVCVGLLAYLAVVIHSPRNPAPNAVSTTTTASGAPGQSVPTPPASPSPAPQARAPLGETPQEQTLQQTISANVLAGVPAYTVDGVVVDPRNQGYGLITAAVNDPLNASTARPALVQVAGSLAHAAGIARLGMVTIRIIGSAGGNGPSLLFVADAAPASFTGADAQTLASAAPDTLFQHVWWSSYV